MSFTVVVTDPSGEDGAPAEDAPDAGPSTLRTMPGAPALGVCGS